jgi:hypothetical protein
VCFLSLSFSLAAFSLCYSGNEYRIIIPSYSPALHGITMLSNRASSDTCLGDTLCTTWILPCNLMKKMQEDV